MLNLRHVPVLILLSVLAGCQTDGDAPPSLSLGEAKKVTANFETGFVLPPRTIKDITVILDQQKRKDRKSLAKLRQIADQSPPDTSDLGELAKFYFARGRSANDLGRGNQAISDYRKSADFAIQSGANNRFTDRAVLHYGYTETSYGNFGRGVEGLKESIRLAGRRRNPTGTILGIHTILAGVYARAGELGHAEHYLRLAKDKLPVTYGWSDPMAMAHILSVYDNARAMVLAARGELTEAESVIRKALERWRPYRNQAFKDPTSDPKSTGRAYDWYMRTLTQILLNQGRFVEAEVQARESVLYILSLQGRYSSYTAKTLDMLTSTIREQGRFEEASQLASASIEILERAGAASDSRSLAAARSVLADTLVAQGKWESANAIYARIKKDMAVDPATYKQFFAGNMSWALAHLNSGNPSAARNLVEAVIVRNTRQLGKKHYATAEATGFLGAIQLANGEKKRAVSNFLKAVPILLSRSRQSSADSTSKAARDQRLGAILESYLALLADIHGTELETQMGVDAADEAFRIADHLRGRSVQRALAASSARAAASDPELADLARREQDAQKQVAILWGLLSVAMSRPETERDADQTKDLRTRIDDLRSARAALMEEIEARFPQYAQLINPKPPTLNQARAVLRPGEALISTFVGKDRTYVWALPRRGEMAFAAVDISREELSDKVDLLRAALDPNAATLGDIPAFDLAAAYGLYKKLLKPVEAGWKGARNLSVVAHGPLGYLPLSILPTRPVSLAPEIEPLFANYRDVPWLVRNHGVTMLPSVASLLTLRRLPAGSPGRRAFIGFGDPWFNKKQAASAKLQAEKPVKVAALTKRGIKTRGLPVRLRAAPATTALGSADLGQLPRLPDTESEVRAMALALNADFTRDVFLGARASEGMVKSANLSNYRVISFATHGLVPGDLNGLTQPALALSAPDVAGDTNNDGLLTLGEILGLKLDADWVVLSACNTGSGEGAGAEAVSGLGRAFFYAGTRALLVSNWPVETTSAKALTSDLFKRQATNDNLSRGEALRQTMNSLIDGPGFIDPTSGKTVFSYGHPIFWAPFSLIGDGGGAIPQG